MRSWRCDIGKRALTAFVLMFAVQAIATPGLCAVHDGDFAPTRQSIGVDVVDVVDGLRASASAGPYQGGLAPADQPLRAGSDPDPCSAPSLPGPDPQGSDSGQPGNVVNMLPGWHRAVPPGGMAESAELARRAGMTPPPPQGSTFDIAPRLRI